MKNLYETIQAEKISAKNRLSNDWTSLIFALLSILSFVFKESRIVSGPAAAASIVFAIIYFTKMKEKSFKPFLAILLDIIMLYLYITWL